MPGDRNTGTYRAVGPSRFGGGGSNTLLGATLRDAANINEGIYVTRPDADLSWSLVGGATEPGTLGTVATGILRSEVNPTTSYLTIGLPNDLEENEADGNDWSLSLRLANPAVAEVHATTLSQGLTITADGTTPSGTDVTGANGNGWEFELVVFGAIPGVPSFAINEARRRGTLTIYGLQSIGSLPALIAGSGFSAVAASGSASNNAVSQLFPAFSGGAEPVPAEAGSVTISTDTDTISLVLTTLQQDLSAISNVLLAAMYTNYEGVTARWDSSGTAVVTGDGRQGANFLNDVQFSGGVTTIPGQELEISADEEAKTLTIYYSSSEDTLEAILSAINDSSDASGTLLYGSTATNYPEDPPFQRGFHYHAPADGVSEMIDLQRTGDNLRVVLDRSDELAALSDVLPLPDVIPQAVSARVWQDDSPSTTTVPGTADTVEYHTASGLSVIELSRYTGSTPRHGHIRIPNTFEILQFIDSNTRDILSRWATEVAGEFRYYHSAELSGTTVQRFLASFGVA